MVWLGAVIFAVLLFAVIRGLCLSDEDAYWRAYEAAQAEDLRWARAHPGCTWAEAHRHREAVRRRFHRS